MTVKPRGSPTKNAWIVTELCALAGLRELDTTFEHERPYFIMHEADEDRGGMPLHVLREDFASVRPLNSTKLFSKETPIITWHRVQDYQL